MIIVTRDYAVKFCYPTWIYIHNTGVEDNIFAKFHSNRLNWLWLAWPYKNACQRANKVALTWSDDLIWDQIKKQACIDQNGVEWMNDSFNKAHTNSTHFVSPNAPELNSNFGN